MNRDNLLMKKNTLTVKNLILCLHAKNSMYKTNKKNKNLVLLHR